MKTTIRFPVDVPACREATLAAIDAALRPIERAIEVATRETGELPQGFATVRLDLSAVDVLGVSGFALVLRVVRRAGYAISVRVVAPRAYAPLLRDLTRLGQVGGVAVVDA